MSKKIGLTLKLKNAVVFWLMQLGNETFLLIFLEEGQPCLKVQVAFFKQTPKLINLKRLKN